MPEDGLLHDLKAYCFVKPKLLIRARGSFSWVIFQKAIKSDCRTLDRRELVLKLDLRVISFEIKLMRHEDICTTSDFA